MHNRLVGFAEKDLSPGKRQANDHAIRPNVYDCLIQGFGRGVITANEILISLQGQDIRVLGREVDGARDSVVHL